MKQESFCADLLRVKGLPLSERPPQELLSEPLWKVFRSADRADNLIPKFNSIIHKHRGNHLMLHRHLNDFIRSRGAGVSLAPHEAFASLAMQCDAKRAFNPNKNVQSKCGVLADDSSTCQYSLRAPPILTHEHGLLHPYFQADT